MSLGCVTHVLVLSVTYVLGCTQWRQKLAVGDRREPTVMRNTHQGTTKNIGNT